MPTLEAVRPPNGRRGPRPSPPPTASRGGRWRTAGRRSSDVRPPCGIEGQQVDAQSGRAVVTVVVVDEDVAVHVREHVLVPGAVDAALAGEDLRAAAGGHGRAVAGDVGAGDA